MRVLLQDVRVREAARGKGEEGGLQGEEGWRGGTLDSFWVWGSSKARPISLFVAYTVLVGLVTACPPPTTFLR